MSRSLLIPAARICPVVVLPLVLLAATMLGQATLAAQSNQNIDTFSSKFLNRGSVANKSRTTVVKIIESSPLPADEKPIVSVKTIKRATSSTARRATVKPKRFKNEFITKERRAASVPEKPASVPEKSVDAKEIKSHPFRPNPANVFASSPQKDDATRPAFESPFGEFQPLAQRPVAGAADTTPQPPVELEFEAGPQKQPLPTASNDANVSQRNTTKVVELDLSQSDLSQSGEMEIDSEKMPETIPFEKYEGPMPGAMSSVSVNDLKAAENTESPADASDWLKPEETPSERVAALPAPEVRSAATPIVSAPSVPSAPSAPTVPPSLTTPVAPRGAPVAAPERPQIESGPNRQPRESHRYGTADELFPQEASPPEPEEKFEVPELEQDAPSVAREADEPSDLEDLEDLEDLDAEPQSEEDSELDDYNWRRDPFTDRPQRSNFSNSWPSRAVDERGIDIRERSSVVPPDRSGELIHDGGGDWGAFSTAPKNFAWAAPNIRYQPLYLEDVALERYGQTPCGWAEAVVSYAHFFKSTALLPYSMLKECPHSCDSPLGYCRPGAPAPKIIQRHFWR